MFDVVVDGIDVMGVVVWSPLLDRAGNSVRGVAFSRKLVEQFAFHNFDNLVHMPHTKQDPTIRNSTHETKEVR